MTNLRRLARGLAWVLSLVVILCGSAFVSLPLVLRYFPEYFGNHDFWVACKAVKPGMSEQEVRSHMAAFLYDGRMCPVTPPGRRSEHRSCINFIPGLQYDADFCDVVFDAGKVTRVVLSPD